MPRRIAKLARWTRLSPLWARLLATTVTVTVAFGLRWVLLGPGPGYPYLLAFPAVIVSGLAFNRGSAFLAVALCAVLGVFLCVTPVGSLQTPDPRDALALVLFLATGVFIAGLIEDLHGAVHE